MTREKFANQYDNGRYCSIGNRPWVELFDQEIHPVLVTEDPAGDYWGWRDKEDAPGEMPCMVQLNEALLSMCFPYGLASSVKRGQGVAVRLRIEPR
jgi:hypothetical protein